MSSVSERRDICGLVRKLFLKIAPGLIAGSSYVGLLAQPAPDATNVAALEKQVSQHLREQKPQLAIPVLRQILSADPKNVNAQANLGVLLHFQGKHDEAIPHLRTSLQLQTNLWRIQALLGISEKRTGNLSQALIDLEQSFSQLDQDKIGIQVGVELIEIHGAAAQFEKALAVAVRLGQLAPNDPQVLLATYQIARQTMDQATLNIMLAAPDSAESHMITAGELAREGNQAKAIAEYRAAIRLNPALPGVHFQLAELMRTSTDSAISSQAEAEYHAALKLNPYDALSWRQLGGIRNAKGEFKAAEEAYNKALALQPNDAEAQTGLAIVLISTNRADQAMSLLESALKNDPTNMTAHFRLSGLYRRAGRTADAEREMAAFRRYQELKDKLGSALKVRRGSGSQQQ
jgi:tetratricopeptide (TPR) repeat protein